MTPILLVWLLFLPCASRGQNGGSVFDRLTVEDGLPNNLVFDIHQDMNDFLWVGTDSGLARFDGASFIPFAHNPNDQNSLSSDDVVSLLVDHQGILWVGAWDGRLNRFDAGSRTVKRFNNPYINPTNLGGNRIYQIVQDYKQRLWLGTDGNGLHLFDPISESFRQYALSDQENGLANYVWSIHGTEEHTNFGMWLGTNAGVIEFDPETETVKPFIPDDSAPWADLAVRSVYLENDRTLWIGTEQRGLCRFDLHSGMSQWFVHDPDDWESICGNSITAIYKDGRSNMWVGTRSGLARYKVDTGGFENHLSGKTDNAQIIHALYEDQTDVMWIGTRRGLFKLDRKPRKFSLYQEDPSEPDSISSGSVSSILSDPQGNIWVGTDHGLNYINRISGRITVHLTDPLQEDSLSDNHVTSVVRTDEYKLWVGTKKGLNLMDGDRFIRYYHDPDNEGAGPADDRINSLLTDSSDHVWIGTENGLSRFDGSGFSTWRHNAQDPKSLAQSRIQALCEGEPGIIWVGTNMRGLDRFDTNRNRITHFRNNPNDSNSLSNNSVLYVCEEMGFLWVGTEGGGLNRMTRLTETSASFRCYRKEQGLPSNTVYGIVMDVRKDLWISTDRGLSRFSITEETFRNYDVLDGLQNNRFLAGSVHRSSEGELFFGGVSGLNSFFPRLVQDNPYKPKVMLTHLSVPTLGKQDLSHLRELKLDHRDNVINLEFAAMDFTMPEKNRYQFILEGFKGNVWSESQTHRTTAFTNLPAGDYVFKVKAANNDHLWSEEQELLTIKILPPVYQSKIAYAFYALIGSLILWTIILILRKRATERANLRLKHESDKMQKEADRAKQAFLANMSHDLRTPLTAIIGYSELIEEETQEENAMPNIDRIKPDLAKIKSSAYQQLALVTNLLELSKLEAGQVELFLTEFNVVKEVEEMLFNFRAQLAETGNSFRFLVPEKIGEIRADRIKVLEIISNLLNNANKFTRNGSITLNIRKLVTIRESSKGKREWVVFTVKDTGIGMPPDQVEGLFVSLETPRHQRPENQSGLGMELCYRFCNLMGGDIEVTSDLEKGTKVTVRLPAWVNRAKVGDHLVAEDMLIRGTTSI